MQHIWNTTEPDHKHCIDESQLTISTMLYLVCEILLWFFLRRQYVSSTLCWLSSPSSSCDTLLPPAVFTQAASTSCWCAQRWVTRSSVLLTSCQRGRPFFLLVFFLSGSAVKPDSSLPVKSMGSAGGLTRTAATPHRGICCSVVLCNALKGNKIWSGSKTSAYDFRTGANNAQIHLQGLWVQVCSYDWWTTCVRSILRSREAHSSTQKTPPFHLHSRVQWRRLKTDEILWT